jgi:multiple sugar transport system substrate-binding protein
MVFGDPAELAAYQTLVEAFRAKHPEIQVELVHIPSQSDYRARLGADLAAGTAADVVLINYRRYAQFAQAGALEPLAPYLAKSKLIQESDFYPQSVEPFVWNGQLMCIPQNLSSLVVYYNQDLFTQAGVPFPQAGWDWDDFVQTARSLTKDTDGDGVTDQYGLGIEPTLIRLAPFLWQAGAELTDNSPSPFQGEGRGEGGQLSEGTAPTRLMLDTPEALRAVQFFVDLSLVQHVVPTAEEEAAEDSESRFINGRTVMFFNSRRGVPTYREITAFDWDVAPLPTFIASEAASPERSEGTQSPGNEETASQARSDIASQVQPAASVLHSDAYCLPSASRNKAAAWAFIEYANSVEGQTIVAQSGRTVPSLVQVAQSSAFLDPLQKPASSQVFLDAIPTLRALPVLPNWVDIEEIADQEIQRAFYGQASVFEAVLSAIRRTSIYFGAGE